MNLDKLDAALAKTYGYETPPNWWKPTRDWETAAILLERFKDWTVSRDSDAGIEEGQCYFCSLSTVLLNGKLGFYTSGPQTSVPLAVSLTIAEYYGIDLEEVA